MIKDYTTAYDELFFCIAGINFHYEYSTPMQLSIQSPIHLFLNFSEKDCVPDITNRIIVSDSYYIHSMENPKFKTPAWTLFDDVVLFHPDGEEIAKMVYNREMGFTAVTTYVRDILFPMQPLPICITGFLLQMFMFLKKDGLIVHGGVIQSNKSVLVVSGNSGAGKSTIANLIKSHLNFSATQIADDRFIMRKHGNDIYAFGNPFDTKLERNKNVYVPIGNFLFLRHGKSNTIRQLNSKDAAINFFKVFMLPYWDIDLLKWSVGYIETLLKFIPCFEYYFLPDESSVEFLIKKNLL